MWTGKRGGGIHKREASPSDADLCDAQQGRETLKGADGRAAGEVGAAGGEEEDGGEGAGGGRAAEEDEVRRYPVG